MNPPVISLRWLNIFNGRIKIPKISLPWLNMSREQGHLAESG